MPGSDALPGWRLRQIACRTLSRDANDPRPIPQHYLRVLPSHLQQYPQEDNFLIDLEDGGGTLTCLDCWTEVLVADKEGKLKGFDAFWTHIATVAHQDLASKRLGHTPTISVSQKPMFISGDHTAKADRGASQGTLSAPAARTRKRVMRIVQFPDGEFFEYSTDEDEQHGSTSSLQRTPSTSSGNTTPFDPPYSHTSPSNVSSDSKYLFHPLVSSSQYSTPTNHMSPTGTAAAHTSSFGSSSYPSFDASRTEVYPSNGPSTVIPTKRPHRGVRRHDFGGGDVVYLSTDDETVDERPSASLDKKSRLGGALLKTEHGVFKSEYGRNASGVRSAGGGQNIHEYDSQPIVEQSITTFPNPTSSFAPQVAIPPQSMYQQEDPGWGQAIHWSELYQDDGWHNGMLHDDYSTDQFGVAMPGGFGTEDGMEYHTHPVPAANPVYDGQTVSYNYQRPAENLNPNIDGSGPKAPIHMGGLDHMQKMKVFFLSTMEDLHEMPKVVDAARALGLPEPAALLNGLEVQLMPHQLIGVSWMVAQETKSNIRGGILADDMGLGKTVQCIATCAKNMPAETDDARRSTLIVAPAALLEQWAAEFRERTVEGLFRVHIHHGTAKLQAVWEVQQYDVVITTYQTLCSDFPKDKKGKGKAKAGDDGDFEGEDTDVLGPLAATEWYRVVLDEAQFIRNRLTRSSRCVARLNSTYRWVITGTPVTNTLADIYSLVRFLQFRPFNDWKEFYERIAKVQKKRPDLAGQRAQALLKKCLLRRTKNTKLEGKMILQLPSKHIEVIEVEFSPEERQIYDLVEEQQKQRMSRFLKAGTVMKNYAVILVMLLRLRQVCNHPQLIVSDQNNGGDHVVEGEGLDGDQRPPRADRSPAEELKRAAQLLGNQFVEEAKSKLRELGQARILSERQGAEFEEENCPICFDPFVNNCCITRCKHLFCSECLDDVFKNKLSGVDVQDAGFEEGVADGFRLCPVCRTRIHPDFIFKTEAFEPSPSELDALIAGETRTTPHAPELIDLTLDEDNHYALTNSESKEKNFTKGVEEFNELDLQNLDRREDFEPSAKMLKMMDLIKQWHATSPKDKIICYSQWTSMLDLVENLLGREKIDTTRFDGRMSRIHRDDALARFKRRDGPSIMLISLKCGGVGLNLVEANRVLCLDLAWNAATENQAFDRVHRLGQQKEVYVKRLIVSNTVEERILNLQAKKQSLADAALGEGKAQKIKRMTVEELKALFGM